jgi:hypothetical protein
VADTGGTKALRGLLYLGGAVATGAGIDTMLRGSASLPGNPGANAAVESELRYYGAFYAAFGLHTFRVAARAEPDPAAVRTIAAVVFAGGLARARGWLREGRPNTGQIALLAIELGAPPLTIALQTSGRPN